MRCNCSMRRPNVSLLHWKAHHAMAACPLHFTPPHLMSCQAGRGRRVLEAGPARLAAAADGELWLIGMPCAGSTHATMPCAATAMLRAATAMPCAATPMPCAASHAMCRNTHAMCSSTHATHAMCSSTHATVPCAATAMPCAAASMHHAMTWGISPALELSPMPRSRRALNSLRFASLTPTCFSFLSASDRQPLLRLCAARADQPVCHGCVLRLLWGQLASATALCKLRWPCWTGLIAAHA